MKLGLTLILVFLTAGWVTANPVDDRDTVDTVDTVDRDTVDRDTVDTVDRDTVRVSQYPVASSFKTAVSGCPRRMIWNSFRRRCVLRG